MKVLKAFLVLLIFKSICIESVTYATAKVHRAKTEDDNIHEDYENPQNGKLKKNSPLLIKDIRGLLTCMDDYVSIKECDLTEWFGVSPQNEYKCTDNHVIIEYPFETRMCRIVNKYYTDELTTTTISTTPTTTTIKTTTKVDDKETKQTYANAVKNEKNEDMDETEKKKQKEKIENEWIKSAINVGTFEGKQKEFICHDLVRTTIGYFTSNRTISTKPIPDGLCAIYRLFKISDNPEFYFLVMPKINFVVKPGEIRSQILERLWYKKEYFDYFLMINDLRNSTHIHWPLIIMVIFWYLVWGIILIFIIYQMIIWCINWHQDSEKYKAILKEKAKIEDEIKKAELLAKEKKNTDPILDKQTEVQFRAFLNAELINRLKKDLNNEDCKQNICQANETNEDDMPRTSKPTELASKASNKKTDSARQSTIDQTIESVSNRINKIS